MSKVPFLVDKKALLLALVVCAAPVAALLAAGGGNLIIELGRHIPQNNLVTDYCVGLGWAAVLGLSISFWPVSAQDKRLLRLGWLARSVMTLGIMLLYEYQYDADSFSYFEVSRSPFDPDALRIGHGTQTMFALARLHHAVLLDSYHMMKVSCSMIGLIAVYLFYRAAVRFWKRDEPRLFLALAFYPSIVFWSSIIGKDPISLLGISLYTYAVVAWHQTARLQYLILMSLGILETMFIRAWLGGILLAPLLVFAIYRSRGLLAKLVFLAVVATALYMVAGNGGDKFQLSSVNDLVETAERLRNAQYIGGSKNYIDTGFTSVGSIAAFAPLGMFTALFRPLPGDVNNAFGWLASLEDAVLLFLFLQALRKMRLRELGEPVVAWAGALILIWAAAYSTLSIQNLGAAVRYKLQILPLLVCLILYLNRPRPAGARKPSAPPQRSAALA